jgi:hypothetical protein
MSPEQRGAVLDDFRARALRGELALDDGFDDEA